LRAGHVVSFDGSLGPLKAPQGHFWCGWGVRRCTASTENSNTSRTVKKHSIFVVCDHSRAARQSGITLKHKQVCLLKQTGITLLNHTKRATYLSLEPAARLLCYMVLTCTRWELSAASIDANCCHSRATRLPSTVFARRNIPEPSESTGRSAHLGTLVRRASRGRVASPRTSVLTSKHITPTCAEAG